MKKFQAVVIYDSFLPVPSGRCLRGRPRGFFFVVVLPLPLVVVAAVVAAAVDVDDALALPPDLRRPPDARSLALVRSTSASPSACLRAASRSAAALLFFGGLRPYAYAVARARADDLAAAAAVAAVRRAALPLFVLMTPRAE